MGLGGGELLVVLGLLLPRLPDHLGLLTSLDESASSGMGMQNNVNIKKSLNLYYPS